MNLNKDDIKTLAMFAYHRTLVRYDSEALAIYRFLAAIDQDELRWKLGAGLCLVRQGAFDEAARWLSPISLQNLAKDQSDLLTRLRQHIAHHKEISDQEISDQETSAQKEAYH